MKFKREYFCRGPKLLRNIDEIHEVEAAITDVAWKDHFRIEAEGHTYEHQNGYKPALAAPLLAGAKLRAFGRPLRGSDLLHMVES